MNGASEIPFDGAPDLTNPIRFNLTASAGNEVNAIISSPGAIILSVQGVDPAKLMTVIRDMVSTELAATARMTIPNGDTPLSSQIDAYRTLLDEGLPSKAAALLENLLKTSPGPPCPTDTFRIKILLGHCRLQLGDDAGAARLIEQGCDAAPDEPKALANRVLVYSLRGDDRTALDYAREKFLLNPENEWLAAQIYRLAATQDGAEDAIATISEQLQNREGVTLWRVFFLRNRQLRPQWWEIASQGFRFFPENKQLKIFAAEAVIDRAAVQRQERDAQSPAQDEHEELASAISVIEKTVLEINRSEHPNRDAELTYLNTVMIGKHTLSDRDSAAVHASELIERSGDERLLFNAVEVALSCDNLPLAEKGLAKLPENGKANFLRGILAICMDRWTDAVAHFSTADVPTTERAFVEAIIRLSPVAGGESSFSASEIQALADPDGDDARVPVMEARLALRRGFPEVAKSALSRAVDLLRSGGSSHGRHMVVALAHDMGEFGTILDILDDYVELGVYSHELQVLADAHAQEIPRRERNIRFFDRLSADVLSKLGIMRAHASVLFGLDRMSEAEPKLRRIIAEAPHDGFTQLRLLALLQRTKRDAQASRHLLEVDEKLFLDQPRIAILWATQLYNVGLTKRAMELAYQTVRGNPCSSQVALGYINFCFPRGKEILIPDEAVSAVDCAITIAGSSGETDTLIIDTRGSVLGVETIDLHDPRSVRLLGKAVGETWQDEGLAGQTHKVTVTEVMSKYLYILRCLFQQFSIRYPGEKGLSKIEMEEDDVQPLLDLLKSKAEADKKTVLDLYVRDCLPLTIVAKVTGRDVIELTGYLRLIRQFIVTSAGDEPELERAVTICLSQRGGGAVLDEYTARVCADLGLLKDLAGWFGTISVPKSVIDRLDLLIQEELVNLGRDSHRIGWYEGQFFINERDDKQVGQQIRALRQIKSELTEFCDVCPVVMPDKIDEGVRLLSVKYGQEHFEPGYLAASRNALLISDDLYYRQIVGAIVDVPGAWIQAFLLATDRAGTIGRGAYLQHITRLAEHSHHHLRFDTSVMVDLFLSGDDPNLMKLGALAQFIGGPTADMRAHSLMVLRFLQFEWAKWPRDSRLNKATSLLLGALIRDRKDWAIWLVLVYSASTHDLRDYIDLWVRGHFLDAAAINDASRHWAGILKHLQQVQLAKSKFSVSRRTMRIAAQGGFLLRPAQILNTVKGEETDR